VPRRACELLAKHPNHVWLVDFTRVGSIFRSLFAGAVVDAFSRKVLALRVCVAEPSAAFAVRLLREAVRGHGAPSHLITDHGRQFTSRAFARAVARRGIRHRYGAVARTGSRGLARIDRFWRTLKDECARGLFLYRPLRSIERDHTSFVSWFNAERLTRPSRSARRTRSTPDDDTGGRASSPAASSPCTSSPAIAASRCSACGRRRSLALSTSRLRRPRRARAPSAPSATALNQPRPNRGSRVRASDSAVHSPLGRFRRAKDGKRVVPDDEHVFLSARGGRPGFDYRPPWIWALRRAGLDRRKGLTFCSLRHSMATHFLERGSPADLQQIMGHASYATTERYAWRCRTGLGRGSRRWASAARSRPWRPGPSSPT
jgi:integrase